MLWVEHAAALDMADLKQDTTMTRAGSGSPSSLVDLTADALGAVFRSLSSTDLAQMPYVCRHLRDAMIVTGERPGHPTQLCSKATGHLSPIYLAGKIYDTLSLDLSKAAGADHTDPVTSMMLLDLSLWLARRGPFATALQICTPDLGQESQASDAVYEALRSCRVERLSSLRLHSSGRQELSPPLHASFGTEADKLADSKSAGYGSCQTFCAACISYAG